MISVSILASFWTLLALFFDTFSVLIFACFFGSHFFDFWSKMVPKMVRGNLDVVSFWRPMPPQNAPKTHPRHNLDISEILEAVLVIFWRFWLQKSSNWDPTAAPASILASFWKPFSINVHNFFGIKFCMPFLNAFFSASDACFYQCPPVSCIKIIASTARISRCRRSPRTTIRRHRLVSGVLNKRSQIAKRRLRRLALLTPRGPTFGTFVAHFGVILLHFRNILEALGGPRFKTMVE